MATLTVNGFKRCSSDGSDFPPIKRKKDENYLTCISLLISTLKGKCYNLSKPAGAKLRITGLEGTVYKDYPLDVNGWGQLYLPNTVTMKVVGVVEGISCLCDQLVLITCEDQKMYVYDEESLHLVASSMEQLFREGIEYPASKSYDKGECFRHMDNKSWEKVRSGAVGRRLDEEHKKLVATRKPRLLEYLKSKQLIKSG